MGFTEEHLKAQVRQEGYMEIMMYVPDPNITISSVSSNDILQYSDIEAIKDIRQYSNITIATLEENLWLLNGRFPNVVDGTTTPGYISNTMSDDNGEFEENPNIIVNVTHPSKVEYFSVMLNPSVPSAYPNTINIIAYDNGGNELGTFTQDLVYQEDTGEIDEDTGEPIMVTKLLNTLPSVMFEMNLENVSKLEIEFVGTRYRHRRVRVSTILFGKLIYINQNDIVGSDFLDKTSYAADTIPSRTFKFDLNNYDHIYDVDNPNNGFVELDKQTRVMVRNGYNIYGYEVDEHDNLVLDTNGYPIIDNPYRFVDIAWDDWKELRLINVLANNDESATFECGSMMDVMDETYTQEYFNDQDRTIGEIADDVLTFEGLPLDTIEWSSDGIKKPTYDGNTLLPYEQWEDTSYRDYKICTVLPEASCREIIQLLAFTVGATILIKDNGHIKFANLDITKPSTFTNQYEWNYRDFEEIPAAEQLESVYSMDDISIPKYRSKLNKGQGVQEISTVTVTSVDAEITYSACAPTGATIAPDDTSGATVQSTNLFARRGIIRLGGLTEGAQAKVVIYGYPIETTEVQERSVTSNSLVLDTKLIKEDINSYNSGGSINQREMIKRKYYNWYNKKFKYKITTRGEPLVNAGDYAIIQTQFSQRMPVYILQNHWGFDGTWYGDMEVIALG